MPMPGCPAEAGLYAEDDKLICDLGVDHPGSHYDAAIDINWSKGTEAPNG